MVVIKVVGKIATSVALLYLTTIGNYSLLTKTKQYAIAVTVPTH
jgi:hypothetical protein